MNSSSSSSPGFFRSIAERARQPIPIDSIALFRIAFGAVLFWEVVRFFLNGWVHSVYIDPPFHFTYPGFAWVRPLPEWGMYLVFLGLGFAAACVCLGLYYRVAIAAVFLGMTYLFLLEKAVYLNHAYLICLLSFVMIFIPAQGRFSFDARQHPRLRSNTIAAGWLWLLRFHIGLPYFYGGLAKVTPDWLQGQPLQLWLMEEAKRHPNIPGLDSLEMALFFSYGGLLLDLLIVPALLWKRTRAVAFALAVMFHLTNAFLFHIGIFPWMMICATTVFFEPDWPRRWAVFRPQEPAPGKFAGKKPDQAPLSPPSKFVLTLAGLWCLGHLLVPFRHGLYPTDVNWSEQGYRFSWRMMLNEKLTLMQIVYEDPQTGRVMPIDPLRPPPPVKPLTLQQVRRISQYPDMLHEYALELADQMAAEGRPKGEVRALLLVALNGRRPQLFLDPETNLAAEPRGVGIWKWIKPLEEPLPDEPWLVPPPKWPQYFDLSKDLERLQRSKSALTNNDE